MSHDPAETAIAAGGGPGDDLYRIVCDYASLGHHRSGTDHDRATAEWFTDLVSDLGTVTETAVDFERYNVASELIADGRRVDHLALCYEFTGEIDTTDVAVRRFDPRSGGFPRIADELIRETKQAGHEALVIAMTTLTDPAASPMAAHLADAGIGLRCNTESWIGEGEAWSRLGVPLLSTTGAGVDFHTPSDTPERVSSPGALATVADAAHRAVVAFHDAIK